MQFYESNKLIWDWSRLIVHVSSQWEINNQKYCSEKREECNFCRTVALDVINSRKRKKGRKKKGFQSKETPGRRRRRRRFCRNWSLVSRVFLSSLPLNSLPTTVPKLAPGTEPRKALGSLRAQLPAIVLAEKADRMGMVAESKRW